MMCGQWFGEVRPTTFHRPCPQCAGQGCQACDGTGLHPLAARVRWQGLRLADLLASSVEQVSGVPAGRHLDD
jgi:excinuclease UvrABC ATPase subunit